LTAGQKKTGAKPVKKAGIGVLPHVSVRGDDLRRSRRADLKNVTDLEACTLVEMVRPGNFEGLGGCNTKTPIRTV
jgi:hypothetical protein